MAQENINTGAYDNDNSADTIRAAFQKTNANFTELYNNVAEDAEDIADLQEDVGALETSVEDIIENLGEIEENQNNLTQLRNQFWPGETPPSEADVAAYINEYVTFTVLPTQSRVYFRFTVLVGDVYYIYIFDFGGGNGVWGSSEFGDDATPVPVSMIRLLSYFPVTPGDIADGGDTVVVPLGDIFDVSYFLANANGEVRDFSDPEKQYYFSYTVGSTLYLALFIGEPGIYGTGGLPDFTDADFAQVTNSDVPPVPTLDQVNADGNGTTTPLTVKDAAGVPKLAHEKDKFVFTDSEGNAVEYHTNPLSESSEMVLVRMGDVVPREGTLPGFPLKGWFEIDGVDATPFYLRKITPGVTTQYLAIADGIVNLSCFYTTGLGVLFDITPEGISFQSTTGGSVGLSSPQNFSPYLTANSFVQKNYVDNAVAGLFWKTECLVATTGNVSLSGLQTVDGVPLTYGDRVLVKNQSAALQNGIYEVTSGLWQRTLDANTGAELANKTIPITRGTVNQDTWWTVTNDSITINVTDIHFTQTGGMGTYMNGTGLLLAGNVFALDSSYVNGLISAAFAAAHVSRVLKCDLTDGSTLTGSTTETVLGSFLIPAGSGDMDLSILVKLQKTGSGGTSEIKLRLHTSVAVGGSQIALFSTTAVHRYVPFPREFSLKSGVLFGFASANSSVADTATGSNPVSQSYNPAVDNYIIVTGTLANASDSLVQKSLRATYFKPV